MPTNLYRVVSAKMFIIPCSEVLTSLNIKAKKKYPDNSRAREIASNQDRNKQTQNSKYKIQNKKYKTYNAEGKAQIKNGKTKQ